MHTGRVVYTGQVVIDISIAVEHMPHVGGDVFGENHGMHVGGGFNTMLAARRMGAQVLYAGTMGNGVLADMASDQLAAEQIIHTGPILPMEQGYSVAVTDAHAERTFISTRGAETQDPLDTFDAFTFDVTHASSATDYADQANQVYSDFDDPMQLSSHDVIVLSGYSFVHTANTAALERFLTRIAQLPSAVRPTLVCDATPVIAEISDQSFAVLRQARPIWTVNEQEADAIAQRLGLKRDVLSKSYSVTHAHTHHDQSYKGMSELTAALSAELGTVIVRAGKDGAWLSVDGTPARHIPSIAVESKDTNGAGDCHTGVLAAFLIEGIALDDAIRYANIAAALSTTAVGPATCPQRSTVEAYRFARL